MLGELETRLRERGWRGDWGMELERRRVLRADALTRSFADSLRLTGAGVFIASVRAFRVAFMTSVARIERSFGQR